MPTAKLHLGDSRDVLKTLADNSIDCVVTDPPYALVSIQKRFGKDGAAPAQFGRDGAYSRASAGFMSKRWDTGEVAFDPAFWWEVLRVLKPGGHLAAFGGTRSYHRLACAIEDAGFEIRDSIGYAAYVYATGFPKSHNISAGIDKHLGRSREIVGTKERAAAGSEDLTQSGGRNYRMSAQQALTVPASEQAKQWEGWGSALKPAWEPICIARKPLSESSLAVNTLKWGTGGMNIDAGRVGLNGEDRPTTSSRPVLAIDKNAINPGRSGGNEGNTTSELGRWPPNVLLSPEMAAEMDKQSGKSQSTGRARCTKARPRSVAFGAEAEIVTFGHDDEGGASRFFPVLDFDPEWDMPFFFTAKPGQSERNAGCDELEALPPTHGKQSAAGLQVSASKNAHSNHHPTVKPVSVLEWLAKLLCPPGGTILDPFTGSGSTGVAAIKNGFIFIGIEREADYFEIAEARLAYAEGRTGLFAGMEDTS